MKRLLEVLFFDLNLGFKDFLLNLLFFLDLNKTLIQSFNLLFKSLIGLFKFFFLNLKEVDLFFKPRLNDFLLLFKSLLDQLVLLLFLLFKILFDVVSKFFSKFDWGFILMSQRIKWFFSFFLIVVILISFLHQLLVFSIDFCDLRLSIKLVLKNLKFLS